MKKYVYICLLLPLLAGCMGSKMSQGGGRGGEVIGVGGGKSFVEPTPFGMIEASNVHLSSFSI